MKSPHKGWIIEAPGRAVQYVGEEAKIGGLLQRGPIHLEGGRTLFRSLMVLMRRPGMESALGGLRRLYDEAPYNEQWARELRESDYAALNAHGLISMWGALETCIEDTVVSVLENSPDAPALLAAAPLGLPASALGRGRCSSGIPKG